MSVADAGTGTYVTSGATFTLTVTKPVVVNTPPTVTVGKVVNGASYELGNVPAATCSVTDKEDGNSTFDASLGAITGSRAAEGLGSQTASCDYTDAGGLNAKASATYSIVDTSKPLVSVTAPTTTEATGPSTPVVFAATAYDAVDGSRPVTCTTAGGTTYASGDGFPVRTTTLTCSATDKAGNTGTSDPFDVVVEDTTAPEVTTSANVVVGNDAATVTYDDASATDLVDGPVTASCTPASGTTFALGTTTVTCTATDKAGNTGSGSFTVEVQDKTKPVVTVPAAITEEATGAAGATVTWAAATAEDDVDATVGRHLRTDVRCTVFPIGTTTVTCKAMDKAGNTGDSSFTVTVEDTTAPKVSVPAGITEEATSAAGATATFSASAHDVVDGSVATECTPASGSTFGLGQTTVICTATDDAGNTGTGSFTVTVRDTTAPKVTVPADLVVEATGATGAKVAYGDVSAIDTVDGPMNPTCNEGLGYPLRARRHHGHVLGDRRGGQHRQRLLHRRGRRHHRARGDGARQPGRRQRLAVRGDGRPTPAPAPTDVVDGDLPVTCTPASGGAFAARDHDGHLHGEGQGRQHRRGHLHRRGAGPDQAGRQRPGRHRQGGDRAERRDRHLHGRHRLRRRRRAADRVLRHRRPERCSRSARPRSPAPPRTRPATSVTTPSR